MELFCENSSQFLAVNYFSLKSSVVDIQRGSKYAFVKNGEISDRGYSLAMYL